MILGILLHCRRCTAVRVTFADNRIHRTAKDFGITRADGFFITGDMAEISADGYISIVGRAKDLIITGGYNVYPKEIELLIDAVEGVVESAVIGVPHRDFGEAVVALVVAEPGTDVSEESIMVAIGPDLARFKQPKRIIIVDELTRNTMGKVQKKELRTAWKDLFA